MQSCLDSAVKLADLRDESRASCVRDALLEISATNRMRGMEHCARNDAVLPGRPESSRTLCADVQRLRNQLVLLSSTQTRNLGTMGQLCSRCISVLCESTENN